MSCCRFCRAPLTRTFVNLGQQPLANSYLELSSLCGEEPRFPLHAKVCGECLLVQVDHDVPADAIFNDHYAYFSSYSTSWVEHARRYAEMMMARHDLGPASLVVEIASNDGYLLQHFVAKGVPVLGIEPAANCAAAAEQRGVQTEVSFFNAATARKLTEQGRRADAMAANNVLAHVPDLNEFVSGFPILLAPEGVLTIEFPHLLNLINLVQFDTIYHEHYSYLSLIAVERILGRHGMRVFDVERLQTHGGSLRVFVCHANAAHADSVGLVQVRDAEAAAGLTSVEGYSGFAAKVAQVRAEVLAFLRDAKAQGHRVAAYGAAAKGNTLLNYCGVGPALIEVVFDKSPHKQGRLLPGSHIPVRPVEEIALVKPDVLLILPWNLTNEIMAEQAQVRGWGGVFATAIPTLVVR